jgi:alpha-beta hydrolase superfamily lysophospholipase
MRSPAGCSGTDDLASPPPGAEPAFTDVRLPRQTRGLVLVLHGGTQSSEQAVSGTNLSWRRARLLLRGVAGPLADDGIGVVLLRYRARGWNADPRRSPAPVVDARWALDELQRVHDLPVAVLGHSMGARTGVAVADHPSVRGVVALAPWLPHDDPVEPLTGKVLRAAHGSRDRITSAKATRRYVARAAAVADAEFTDMGRVGHYLFSGVRRWNAFAVSGLREILFAD